MPSKDTKKTTPQVKKASSTQATAKKKPSNVKPSVIKLSTAHTSRDKKTETVKKPEVLKAKTMPEQKPKSSVVTADMAKTVKMRRGYIIAAVIIIILGILLYYYRGLFVAAIVNGQPISRLSVIQETEKESGKQALATIVRNTLIEQEANKENVTVSDAEVNAQVNTVKQNLQQQGENLSDVLVTQGMNMDDLRSLLRLDLLVQKMVGKNIVISNKQIDDYISQNQATLPQNESSAKLRATVKSQLEQQELNQKTQQWLQSLQDNAKITYFVQY